MEYNGITYKIGNGATREATQETSKQDEIHRLCAIAAVALCCSSRKGYCSRGDRNAGE